MNARKIVLATITDLADFGKRVGIEAFAARQLAEEWAEAECERIKADSDDPEYCNPVPSYDNIWFTDGPA